VLLLTPLTAPDRQVYAIAQGPVVVGGYSIEQNGSVSQKNHPTVGRVPVGAIVERENPNRLELNQLDRIEWLLDHPDFTTAQRFVETIDQELGLHAAFARDEGSVVVMVPPEYEGRAVAFIARVEDLDITVDAPARVVVNEKTGTVVMGADVHIAPVAVAHAGLSIEIQTTNEVSQPAPFGQGQTVVVPESEITVEEEEGRLTMVGGVTIGELVSALNQLGVKPRDLIQILITIRAAGALHAELEVF